MLAAVVGAGNVLRSGVSPSFVALSTERLLAFRLPAAGRVGATCSLHRRQGHQEHCIVIALGINTGAQTRSASARVRPRPAAVSTALLNDFMTRGLSTDRAMLFLIDGAATLRLRRVDDDVLALDSSRARSGDRHAFPFRQPLPCSTPPTPVRYDYNVSRTSPQP